MEMMFSAPIQCGGATAATRGYPPQQRYLN
jgi:hypothetical protein